MIELNKIYNEPCIETLKRMDDNSIDCVVTSPPYYALRAYSDDPREIGRETTPNEYIDNMAEIFTEVHRVLKPTGTVWVNIGDTYAGNKQGNTNEKWKSANTTAFEKKLTDGLKNKDLIGISWMLAFALRDRIGFYLRQDIVWHKSNAMPEPVKDRCVKSHEYIFLLSKSENYYFDYQAIQEPATTFIDNGDSNEEIDFGEEYHKPDGAITTSIRFGGKKYGDNSDPHFATKSGKEWKPQMENLIEDGQRPNSMHLRRAEGMKDIQYVVRNKRDVWSVNTKPSKLAHCAMYPEELITPCILAGCPENGIIYDPFMGAGTTALATLKSGAKRKFIGSEINSEYVAMTGRRIYPIISQYSLF